MKRSELNPGDSVVFVAERRTSRHNSNVEKNPYDPVGSGVYVTGPYWEAEVVDPNYEYEEPRLNRWTGEKIGTEKKTGVKIRLVNPVNSGDDRIGEELTVEARLLITTLEDQTVNRERAEEALREIREAKRSRQKEMLEIRDGLNAHGLDAIVTRLEYGSAEYVALSREDAEKLVGLLGR